MRACRGKEREVGQWEEEGGSGPYVHGAVRGFWAVWRICFILCLCVRVCVCVCVCVCAYSTSVEICMCICALSASCVGVRVCVCVCLFARVYVRVYFLAWVCL